MSHEIINRPLDEPHLNTSTESSTHDPSFVINEMLKRLPQLTTAIFSELNMPDNTTKETKTGEHLQQFTALDQLSSSKEAERLSRPPEEEALEIAREPNQNIMNFKLLECLEVIAFPIKTMLLIKKLASSYWQAHHTHEPDKFDEKKTYFFANLLIAAFEIKSLSSVQLRNDKEVEIYKMSEHQLFRFAAKLTEKFVSRCIKHSGNEEASWNTLIEHFGSESAPILRRMALSQLDDLVATFGFAHTSDKKEQLINTQKQTEPNENEALEGQSEKVGEEAKEEECNGDADCNNLSMITEGNVTDLDISLPLLLNDSSDSPQELFSSVVEASEVDGGQIPE